MGLLTPTNLFKTPTSETHAVDSFLQDLHKALSEAKEALLVAKPPTIGHRLFEEARAFFSNVSDDDVRLSGADIPRCLRSQV